MRTLLPAIVLFIAAGHASPPSASGLNPIRPGIEAGTFSVAGASYHAVIAPADRLALAGQGGMTPRTPTELASTLNARGERLIAATNGALFHEGFVPVGLHIERGTEHRPLETGKGQGNFYWKPNAVFWIAGGNASITPTQDWRAPSHVELAVQSGPALVLDGELHPGFDPGATSRRLRSGIGVRGDQVVLLRSDGPVTFHAFATVFRDSLGCQDALFLDGTISGLWAEGLPGTRRGFEYASFLYIAEAGPG